MRFVIYGAGAIGGVVGARLNQSGPDVALIARGPHLKAIRRDELTLQTPVERSVFKLAAAEDPAQLGVGAREDVILLAAAAIDASDPNVDDLDGRWERLGVGKIGRRSRAGSSTWQSLARGTGAIETDFLNGEIVLLGRLHGIPGPLNAALAELADRHARAGTAPGSLSPQDILAAA
jgi:ketopantoate reductase